MPKNPHADFTPALEGYSGQGKFRFWCQMALPLTYDDSLSYYELLCKVVNYLNHTIEDVANAETNVSRLAEAYTQLQNYVNNYFDDLDIEAELRNVLDAMAEDGTLDDLLDPLVQDHLPSVVDDQIDDVVADQIDDAVAGQIGDVVAEQLPPLVEEGIPDKVSDWLTENVDPVGSAVVVDSSLTISGAAADAKVTGDELANLKTQLSSTPYLKTLSFNYVSGSGHSSSNDKLDVEIEQGELFYLKSNNSLPYLYVNAHYSDGTVENILNSSNTSFEFCFVASKKILQFGVYFGSPSSNGTFTMYVDYGFKRVFSEIEKRTDEVGTVREHSITYSSGSSHSSDKDVLFISIPAGKKYRITIDSAISDNIGIYEKYGNKQALFKGNVSGKSDTIYTSSYDVWGIGFYFGSQSSSGTANISVRTGSEIKLYELENAIESIEGSYSDYFKTSNIEFEDNKFYNVSLHCIDVDEGYKLAKINVAPFRGGKIKGQTSVAPNSRYGLAFVDSNDGFIAGYPSKHTGYYDFAYELDVPNNASYIYISCRKASENQWKDPEYPWEYALMNLATSIPDETIISNTDVYGKLLNSRHVTSGKNPPLSILHFSDLHGDKGALSRIMNYAKIYDINIADAICTGDMVPGEAEEIDSWWNENVLTCMGNHDTADYESGSYDWTALSMANRDAYYIAPFESNWNIEHTAGTSYYYKDYTTEKVRLIVMDGMLYTGASASGTEATAQTAWLENLLSDAITNSLHVLIAIHAPHGGSTAEICSFSRYNQGEMPTYADCNTPQIVIDTVATKITAGLHFVGYIVGHTHQDNIWDAENDGKQLMYCVTCAAVDTQTSQWINSDQHRDDQHDAFNLITIDTSNTLVKIVRGGGADIDDHIRTRKAICFDYSTGTKVGEVL